MTQLHGNLRVLFLGDHLQIEQTDIGEGGREYVNYVEVRLENVEELVQALDHEANNER